MLELLNTRSIIQNTAEWMSVFLLQKLNLLTVTKAAVFVFAAV